MGLLDRLFGGRKEGAGADPEHAVIVRFNYGSTDMERLFALEQALEQALEGAGTGELDGNELAADGTEGVLYLYGPDAETLFATIRPTLESVDFMTGATASLRCGPPGEGVKEVEVVLGA